MTPEPVRDAESVAVPIRRRTLPERLRWYADLLEETYDPPTRMGASMGIREIADEVWPEEQEDGTYA